jgi:hypothetical protein
MRSSEFGIRNSESRPAAQSPAAALAGNHSAPRIPHSALYPPFPTPHSPLPTPRSALYPPFPTPHSALRTAISLLEVLICIGIVAIGLLSVAALIPVGGVQVQKANVQERKATLGLNAFREFQIRGMDNVQNWVRYNSPNWIGYLPLNLTASLAPLSPGFPDQPYLPPIAIDPLMVAVGQSEGKSAAVSTFPANYIGGPLLPRLTLTSAASFSAGTYTPVRSLADMIYATADDVISDIPSDVSQTGSTALDANSMKHNSNGEFTWLATITPSFASPVTFDTVASTATMQSPQPTNQYALSIVVFDRRILSTPAPATEEQGQEEIVLAASATPATVSVNGGEFTLSDDSSSHTNASAKLDMLRPDQWIMLTRYVPYAYSYTDSTGVSHTVYYPWVEAKWFRVVAAGNLVQSGTIYSRQVTLAGADWEPDPTAANAASASTLYIAPASVTWPASVPAAYQNYNTYACLFDGAVAVYQRVIHLEGPSVWNQ